MAPKLFQITFRSGQLFSLLRHQLRCSNLCFFKRRCATATCIMAVPLAVSLTEKERVFTLLSQKGESL